MAILPLLISLRHRLETHIPTKHKELVGLYFTGEDTESPPEEGGHLTYFQDEENASDGEKIEFLDDKEDENVYHWKVSFIQTFADADRPTGEVRH
ncbi:hypothetical protein Q9L58_010516 [Maublancomyces gigas]|uniref:Uncharacterized protein n=1 Tax=Discina gigas TaxID=1032678 RepID=A0ABR3G3X2_9PEZI